MILDAQLEFSDEQDVGGGGAATVDATNDYDTSSTRDFGPGESLEIICRVGATAFANGTSVDFQFMTGAASPPTTVVATTGALLTAALTANTEVMRFRVPRAGLLRYIGFQYVVVGAGMDAGTVDCWINLDSQENTE